jgi:hypothetical protein
MNKGFVIMAQNTKNTNYVSCAETLRDSVLRQMPDSNITIITEDKLPYGDLATNSDWKLINDWQVYDASPYDYTIKLEADMFIQTDISYWWDVLTQRDLVVCNTIRNYKNEISNVVAYRRFITDNKLPNVYNAITYFKKSELSKRFFTIVRDVFENWEQYKATLKCDTKETCTTDWAYSIACHLVGIENSTLPAFTQMSMIHMKQYVNNLITEDWTRELVYEYSDRLKINTYTPAYPFHYHVKPFVNVLKENI